MIPLYGDGLHDDTAAIQARIDASPEASLPQPKTCYLISRPLELPSNHRLILPRFAEVKLKAGSDCVMLKNKMEPDYAHRTDKLMDEYVNEYSPNAPCCNIEVCGGVWNFNNLEQTANPQRVPNDDRSFNGNVFLFYHVRNLKVSSLTIKNPTTYAVTLDHVTYFTVEEITFDYNFGKPRALNMDGIHVNGNCHFGHISNLKGACYDDLVALNADEGTAGPITDVHVDGLYADNCHSAVRLLSVKCPVERVHISNVYGTYYQYCIGITKFYPGAAEGYFDAITIDNVYASKAERFLAYGGRPDTYFYPLLFLEKELHVRNLKIADVHRREYHVPVPTIFIGKEAEVDHLTLDNITVENRSDAETVPLWENNGTVRRLEARNLYLDGEPVTLSE